jgi:5-methylcytosine-specific restriction endonuclease McrBC regulatory subunit McrC
MREYVYDNPVMQLVRHTIEYIKTHSYGKQILNSNSDIVENVNKIIS